MSRTSRAWVGLLAVAVVGLLALDAAAAPSLMGDQVTVAFREPGFPDEVDVVTVVAGPEIVADNPSTNIGTNILLTGEFIDIGDASIVYRVFGGGEPHAVDGYRTTGFDPDAAYAFVGLDFSPPAGIVGVEVVLDKVVGVAVGSEVAFLGNAVTLRVGTLGVLETPENLGTITLNLQLAPAVPEPAPLAVLAAGLALLGAAARRGRRAAS